jgi:4-diphosphocytidyl-2-C-methyl-D-erythritol kinase
MTAVERAHAKLNVFLRVLGRRGDGFHDIETVVLPLELHDLVTVEDADAFSVQVHGERAEELRRAGGEHLVERAVQVFADARSIPVPDVHVAVEKRIPVGAGMGGGSADAAAVLRVLGARHEVDPTALCEIAARVGSDVPALVMGGAVYATGRGERVVPVHTVTTTWVVKPFPFEVRTPDAYGWWDEDPATGPDPGVLIAALETGNDALLGSALYDDLQPAVAARHPEVAAAIDSFHAAGALGAVMTGSGPSVVALARHLGHADALAAAVSGSFVTTGPPRTMVSPSGVV